MNRVDWYGPNTWSWNPLAMRCAPVGPGCKRCWHLRMANRLAGMRQLPEAERRAWSGKGPPVLREKELLAPLRRKKPSLIAVQFMGDWMHESVRPEVVDRILEVMGAARQHTFLTLTKRPERFEEQIYGWVGDKYPIRELGGGDYEPNVWLGISAEDQASLDARMGPLLALGGGWRRWVSLEPLLGPVDVSGPVGAERSDSGEWLPNREAVFSRQPLVGWVVIGCESGPGRRPCRWEWVRDIIEQCDAAPQGGVPVFVKQMPVPREVKKGEWLYEMRTHPDISPSYVDADCETWDTRVSREPAEWPVWARRRKRAWADTVVKK